METKIPDTAIICELCNKEVDEINPCRMCEMLVCNDCTVSYDQFSQVDYTLCKPCGQSRKYQD